MLLAVDAHYDGPQPSVAGVAFEEWGSSAPSRTFRVPIDSQEAYLPGQFYKRELPWILKLLEAVGELPETIVIDGYVYLDGCSKPGLGKHLFDALGGRVKVIGVAKTTFAGIGPVCEIFRGDSKRPLYVTSEGVELAAAKAAISRMHGPHRMPTLLKLVDAISRGRAAV